MFDPFVTFASQINSKNVVRMTDQVSYVHNILIRNVNFESCLEVCCIHIKTGESDEHSF
jgi:hypothetical protein